MISTKWIVITGPPSSGKTSIINALEEKGFLVSPEVAREIICYTMHSGLLKSHLPRNSLALQREILAVTLRREHLLATDKQIFFDRGTPDSIAYYNYHHFESNEAIKACQHRRYEKVFYCEGLPVIKDNIRLENDFIAKRIGHLIIEAYESLSYKLIKLPVMSLEERVAMVLKNLNIE